MIDLDQVVRACLYIFAGGALVLASHLATMHTVNGDVDDWHDLAVKSHATAARCVNVLEKVDADLLSLMVR
jgi:hypothetical protein